MLLDLRTLDRVNPYTDGKLTYVTAEPGASWGSVYAALDPYGKSVIGARDEDVGVGGLILGGGMPYFSNLYGLASDNVKNFQVCTQPVPIVISCTLNHVAGCTGEFDAGGCQ